MKWTDELIESELKKSIEILNLERMPTGEELKSIGRNDLHCKISRTRKYSGWADSLGLSLKSSNTVRGQTKEFEVAEMLTNFNYDVRRMSTKHPYDLLVNEAVKIDVKFANSYFIGKSKVFTFNLSKKYATCDIYILVTKDHETGMENYFFVPSHLVKQKMITMGQESKYSKFENKLDYIDKYSKFFGTIE